MSIVQTVFGPGLIYAKSSATGSSYKQLGSIQDFSFDESKTMKELHGSFQFPIDVATSTIKLSGKMKQAVINATSYNDIFFGQSIATGQTLTAVGEAGTIPSSTAYTITVSQSAHFTADLGVTYADGSAVFQYIPTGTPTVGQYTVTAGVYTFAAADAGKAVSISYRYSSALTGINITNSQQLIGTTVTFSLLYVSQHNGKEISLEFFKVVAPKLAMQFKLEDFMVPELDLAMFANDAGQAFILNTAN